MGGDAFRRLGVPTGRVVQALVVNSRFREQPPEPEQLPLTLTLTLTLSPQAGRGNGPGGATRPFSPSERGEEWSAKPTKRSSESFRMTNALSPSEGPAKVPAGG